MCLVNQYQKYLIKILNMLWICFLINIISISLKIFAEAVICLVTYVIIIEIIADGVEGKTGSERRPLGDLFWRRLRATSFDAENFHALVIQRIVSEIGHFSNFDHRSPYA